MFSRKRREEVPQPYRPQESATALLDQEEVLPRLFEPSPNYSYQSEHDELTDPEAVFLPASPDEETPETTLGEGVSFKGEISFVRFLRVDGVFEGKDIESEGKLVVGSQGSIFANIKVSSAVIEGRVVGNIEADRLELRSGARMDGNIDVKTLIVDEGVCMKGHVLVFPDA